MAPLVQLNPSPHFVGTLVVVFVWCRAVPELKYLRYTERTGGYCADAGRRSAGLPTRRGLVRRREASALAQQMPRAATTRGDAAWAAVPHEVRQDARKWFGWQGADGSNPELWLRGSTVKVCRLGNGQARMLRLGLAHLAAPGGSRHAGREAGLLGAQPLPYRCSSQPPPTQPIPPPLTI